jgi:hypothetical protein
MEFQTNEKALLINQSDKEDFFVTIERKLTFQDKVIYEYSYNNGYDFGFAYDTFLKKASVKDKCTLYN